MTNPPRKGFVCPLHAVKLHVKTVRPVATGIVRRTYVCPVKNCATRERSEERIKPFAGCRKTKNSPTRRT